MSSWHPVLDRRRWRWRWPRLVSLAEDAELLPEERLVGVLTIGRSDLGRAVGMCSVLFRGHAFHVVVVCRVLVAGRMVGMVVGA